MKWFALGMIRLYQRTVSRLLPPSCRFVPSCSEYGYEAVERYGVVRGGVMAIWRIMRCNPWGGHGYDPVPDLNQRAESREQKAEHRDASPLSTPHSALRTHHVER
jgi:putative membrane protein insertion efficiency factor